MAFRIKIKPLEKRYFKDVKPINNELIIDQTEGNIGVTKVNNDNITYLSGSEKLKSDFESLKIRSDNITKLLPNVNLGSSANTKSSDFSFDRSLNNGDILASLQYVHDCYQPYITEDEEGNIIFDDDSLSIEKDLGDLLNKMYYANSSYDHRIRNALLTVYEDNLMNSSRADLNDISEKEDTIKLRRNLILIELPKLINLERKIDELEYKERLISKVYHENFLRGIDRVLSQTEINNYKINCRKFIDYNNLNFNGFLQTENSNHIPIQTAPDGYKYNYDISNRTLVNGESIINIVNENEIHAPRNNRNTYLLGTKTDENFEDTLYNLNPIKDFVMSPSDRNYDGDDNLFSYTSYYKIMDDTYEGSDSNVHSHYLKRYKKIKDDETNNKRMINYFDQIGLSSKEFLVPLNKDISPFIYNIIFDGSRGYRGQLMYKTIKNTINHSNASDADINDIWNKAFVRKTNNMVNSIGSLIYSFRNYDGLAYYREINSISQHTYDTICSDFLYNAKTVINLKNLPNQSLELIPMIQNKVLRYNKLRHEDTDFNEMTIIEFLINDKFNHFYDDIYFNQLSNNLDNGTYSINNTICNIPDVDGIEDVFKKTFFNYNFVDQHYVGYSPYNEDNKDSNIPQNLYKNMNVADYAKLFKENFIDVIYMFKNMFTSGTTIKEVDTKRNIMYHTFVLNKIKDWRPNNLEPFDENYDYTTWTGFASYNADQYNNSNNDAKLWWYDYNDNNKKNGEYIVGEDLISEGETSLKKSGINSLGEGVSASFAIARTYYDNIENKTHFKIIVKNFMVFKDDSVEGEYANSSIIITVKDKENSSNTFKIEQIDKNPQDEDFFINNYEKILDGEVTEIEIDTELTYTMSRGDEDPDSFQPAVNTECKKFNIDYGTEVEKNWTDILENFFNKDIRYLAISIVDDDKLITKNNEITLFHDDIDYFYKTKEDREFEEYIKTHPNNGGNGG